MDKRNKSFSKQQGVVNRIASRDPKPFTSPSGGKYGQPRHGSIRDGGLQHTVNHSPAQITLSGGIHKAGVHGNKARQKRGSSLALDSTPTASKAICSMTDAHRPMQFLELKAKASMPEPPASRFIAGLQIAMSLRRTKLHPVSASLPGNCHEPSPPYQGQPP
jgi:hypothetical protein